MGCCQSSARPAPAAPATPVGVGLDGHHGTRSANPTAAHTGQTARTTHELTAAPNAPLCRHTGYISPPSQSWTASQLQRERTAFFDTRVTGQQEIWATLRATTELLRQQDIATAQGFIDAAGVTVPTGDLVNGAYDESGQLYSMPEWVVADPENILQDDNDAVDTEREVEATEEAIGDKSIPLGPDDTAQATGLQSEREPRGSDKGKARELRKGEGLKVRVRLSDGTKDMFVWIAKEDTIRSLMDRIREEARIDARLRIAYMGKVLRENDTLTSYGWHPSNCVNAFIAS